MTRPDFLVISPPKTGSTWLADNLRAHPGVFVPAVKEVKYFSSLHRWLDLDWYFRHFEPAAGRLAGEASPSYSHLPLARIRRIRRLVPGVKLVYLMRDPVGRAWSHAKHVHRYREAVFADAPPGPATDEQWRAALADDWLLSIGDPLGQLRRWLAVFPPEQFFVGFYEDIATRPAELLRRVFRFLGADPGIDLSNFPVADRILAGPPGEPPPAVAAFLRGLLRDRTVKVAELLRERFGLTVPAEWQNTLSGNAEALSAEPAAFARDADDRFVEDVVAREDRFPSAYRDVLRPFFGYDLVFYRGRLLALSGACAGVPIPGADDATIDRLLAAGACLTAPTLPALKRRVLARVRPSPVRRVVRKLRRLVRVG